MKWKSDFYHDGMIEKLDEILEFLKSYQKPITIPELLTLDQAAVLLKCSVRTIRYYINEEKSLPYLKVGREIRLRTEDLSDFISSRMINSFNQKHNEYFSLISF